MNPQLRRTLHELITQWAKDHDAKIWAVIQDLVEENSDEGEAALAAEIEIVDRNIRRSVFEELIGEQGNLEKKPWVVRGLTTDEPYWARRTRAVADDEPNEVLRALDGTVLWTNGRTGSHGLWMEGAPEWLTGRDGDLDEDGTYNTVYGGDTEGHEYLLDVNTREIWKRVYSGAHSPEKECPFKTWDPEGRIDVEDRDVALEDTFWGEQPGKYCRFCGEPFGEPHGYISESGAELVYQLLPNVDHVDIVEDDRGLNWDVIAFDADDNEVGLPWNAEHRGWRSKPVFHSREEAYDALRRIIGSHIRVEFLPIEEEGEE